ncbi:hypothetical protein GCM10018962_76860 [Dactylosporangium matsuzakiense]|uniref:Uncharacterized protein n=1 Tax=Dactylosporangium matsuzakiense TaxID=53360 RepID=A0A9W6KR44_9ACTN|nr:hypothetical protein GCM10017581_073570 [Dactylosporangium matsuzakiense]
MRTHASGMAAPFGRHVPAARAAVRAPARAPSRAAGAPAAVRMAHKRSKRFELNISVFGLHEVPAHRGFSGAVKNAAFERVRAGA